MKHFRLIAAVLLFAVTVKGNPPRLLAIVPGLSAGYVFGAGFALGADLNYLPLELGSGSGKTALGLYGSYTLFYANGEIYRDNWYRSLAGGAAALTDNRFLFKAGVAKTVLRWGANHVNKIKSKHITMDFDVSYDYFRKGFFVGYHFFYPGNGCFGLDIKTVNIFYGAYRYNFNRIGPGEGG